MGGCRIPATQNWIKNGKLTDCTSQAGSANWAKVCYEDAPVGPKTRSTGRTASGYEASEVCSMNLSHIMMVRFQRMSGTALSSI